MQILQISQTVTFKYYYRKKQRIILALFTLVIFAYLTFYDTPKSGSIDVLKNHIHFSGEIISFNRSFNHSFGIVKIKLRHSNTKYLINKDSTVIFPYKVKGSYAEFYGIIPNDIKNHQFIDVNSDGKTVTFFDKEKEVAPSSLNIITESENRSYVYHHTNFR